MPTGTSKKLKKPGIPIKNMTRKESKRPVF